MDSGNDAAPKLTAGGAIFTRLRALGVDYVFANSGTDFPPIIEGLAEAAARDIDLPEAVAVPHENAAMNMAYGYWLGSGRAQAVMLHTNVGLANAVTATLDAAMDHVPVLMMSGRTPTMEGGRFGARTVPIGWGQEMRDQTAMVREAVKWDYELRFPEQVGELVDRAHAIATSTPMGPVYMSLPREVLCEPCPSAALDGPPLMAAVRYAPDPSALDRAAEILAAAERPLIVAQRGVGGAEGFAAFSAFAEDWGIPVCHYWALRLAVPTGHPMCVGSDPLPWIGEADAILAIDCMAPWWPDRHAPAPECRVVHLGPDPLFTRTPVRNFRADVSLAGETGDAVTALLEVMKRHRPGRDAALAARRASVAARAWEVREKTLVAARAAPGPGPTTKAWVAHCISEAIAGRRASVLSELGAPLDPMSLSAHDSWYQEPHAGGLGWSVPVALGLQLADRDRLVLATMGDGSYMFANPTACHQVAEALELPVVLVVTNNAEWKAVTNAVKGLYPDGYAARANRMPLTGLSPSPDFVLTARASRGWAEKVVNGADLPAALARAIEVATVEKRHALLDVAVID
ncbi:MAG: thiamine pyrophosphate-requiring protein [Rhodospirillaceae bacterium]